MNLRKSASKLIILFVLVVFSQAAAQDNLENGISAVNRGDYVKASELLKKAVGSEPGSYKANLYYGIALFRTGVLNDAEKYLKKAVNIDDERAEAYNILGQVYTELKKYDDADRSFASALKYSGAGQTLESLEREEIELVVDILSNQAENFVASGQIDKAINALTRARTFDNKNPLIYVGLGDVYLVRGALEPAVTNYNQALALKSGYAPAYYGLGKTYFRQRKYKDALEQFEKAISSDPNLAEAHLEKGRILFLSEKYPPALDAFKKYAELKPGSPVGNLLYARTLYEMGKLDEAMKLLDEVLKANPESMEANRYTAHIYVRNKDFIKAKEYFDKVKEEKFTAEDNIAYAQIFAEQKDFLKAYEYINRAIAMDTTDPQGYFELGKAMFTNQEYEAALENLAKSIDLGVQTVAAYIYKGIAHYNLNNYDSAVAVLLRSIELNPNVGSAYLWLANSYMAAGGKGNEALAAYKKALEFDPNDQFVKDQIEKLEGINNKQ